MRASVLIVERPPAGFVGRTPVSCFFSALFILLCCTGALGQGPIEGGRPDVDEPGAALGGQFITANAARAPAKAQRAAEKAAAAIASNQLKEAEKQLGRALELYPDYGRALTLRAIFKMSTDRSEAIKDLQHAIHVDPQYGLPYAVLASIYNASQRYDDALTLIHRALPLLPNAWQVHYENARALCGKHRNVEALQEVTDAALHMSADIAADSRSVAAVHYLRGILLFDQRKFEEARWEFQMTVKAEPQGPLAPTSDSMVARLDSRETQ